MEIINSLCVIHENWIVYLLEALEERVRWIAFDDHTWAMSIHKIHFGVWDITAYFEYMATNARAYISVHAHISCDRSSPMIRKSNGGNIFQRLICRTVEHGKDITKITNIILKRVSKHSSCFCNNRIENNKIEIIAQLKKWGKKIRQKIKKRQAKNKTIRLS